MMDRKQQAAANKVRVVDLLTMTGRAGMDGLIEWLITNGFFESPASTKYHGSYPGGLAQHSLNVFYRIAVMAATYRIDVPADSLIISALLHDLCKVGAYVPLSTDGGRLPIEYLWNKQQPTGHAKLSITRIRHHIDLTEIEGLMIRYHMGVYGLNELSSKGEYYLRDGGLVDAWNNHPVVKLMYFADELATLGEMAEERNEKGGAR